MKIEDRFISYTKIDTTSYDSETAPSTPNQFILANQLKDELIELGIENAEVDENCFVYGCLPANCDKDVPVIGLLAHMDTSNATSGANIKARIIEDYDGNDIELSPGIYSRVEDYPELANLKGKRIIVSDGTTLLGGDDKAGIAIIMQTIEYLREHPEIKHGQIIVSFTPDEETGLGIGHINLDKFKVDYAYTIDGGKPNGLTYECFNAASAHIIFNGNSIHPGSAKGKMINAIQLAIDFHNMLPAFDRPENTEGREGFNHCTDLTGTCQKAEATYIIRNHDYELLNKQIETFKQATQLLNTHYGKEVVQLHVREQYHNMRESFNDCMYIIDNARKAIEGCGYSVESEAARGGTDGSSLSFRGVPTPNLGTGGYYCHGDHELVCIDEMEEMVKIVTEIIKNSVQ